MKIKNVFKLTVLVLIVNLIVACSPSQDKLIKKQYFIFGTIIEVLIWHDDESLANKALLDVETELNGMHKQWHAWKPGRLNKINTALRKGESFTLTNEEKQFILISADLSKKSLGYFNPAIGELINIWGFHTDDYPITQAPPDDAVIQEFISELPTMDNIIISNNQISSNNQRIWIDFGGIAKGYAIDKAINIIKQYGIKNAIVNAGGDLRSIGSKGDKNWKVAIRKPDSEDIFAIIMVTGDESIFTSGNYERYKQYNGKRYAHILDPQTGYGVEHIVSATVIAENGIQADAAATALIVAGTDNWIAVMQSMNLNQVLLINQQGQCFATVKMLDRINEFDLKCKSVN